MDSTINTGTNYPELTGLESGKVLIPTYYWKAYLGPFFKHTSNVSKKHHFRMLTSEPGVLHSRVNLNTEEVKEQLLVKPKKLPKGFLDVVEPEGLSSDQKTYLFNEIRQFVNAK